MPDGTPVVYVYDGSFEGLLCTVYESYHRREHPEMIVSREEPQETLYPVVEIHTNLDQAQKVEAAIEKKISTYALSLVRHCYYAAVPRREEMVLHFLRLGFRLGPAVVNHLAHEAVVPVLKTAQLVGREANAYREFSRFSDYNGALAAIIAPIHFVLPLVAPYFCDRFPSEQFLIYDENHSTVFLYQDGKRELLRVEAFELPAPSAEEEAYRALWKQFYKSIAIESRINHKRRMGHMPKRYWRHMTEFF